jgi:hypothetical protein
MFAQILPVIRGEAVVQPVLLKLVTTVEADAVTRFVAADAFGPNNPDGIKFFLGGSFKCLYWTGKSRQCYPEQN